MKKTITQAQLREHLSYDENTGIFTWIKKYGAHSPVSIGSPAGTKMATGYIMIRICGGYYLAHRLAFLYMTGEYPGPGIDHIDCVKHNNKWSNLRKATSSQNMANKPTYKNNKLGIKGVHKTKYNRYHAQIKKDGKVIHLGIYDNANDAHKAYCDAAEKYHGEFARMS